MEGSWQVSSRGLMAPITSLLFHNGFLLAGEGPNLLLYLVKDTTTTLSDLRQVFTAARTHGIRQRKDGALCVFGGKSCRLVRIKDARLQCESEEKEFPDWIWDIAWLDNAQNVGSPWTTALALGHNWVVNYDWQSGEVLATVHCQETCILYSALFLGTTWASLVLAAGTVSNQVILWAIGDERDPTGRRSVLHRLHGHKGVIFSMAYQEHLGVFCSVSDDRSIQLWRVTWPATYSSSSSGTGAWSEAEFQLMHTLFGHTARVWDIRLGARCLVSVGEDATCCIWNYEGQVQKKLKGHKGKGIWSLDIDEDLGLVATGGGDGGIFIWELSAEEARQNEVNSHTLPPPQSAEIFFPRTIKLLSHDALLVMSDEGSLYQYNTLDASWKLLFADTSFRSYSVMEADPAVAAVAVGNIGGQLRVMWNGFQADVGAYPGKVFSLCWLRDPASHAPLLLSTGPGGHMILWCVELTPAGINVDQTAQFTLPPSKQRWVSCADMIPDSCLLACGDRVGSIHLFDLQQQGDPVQSLWKLHGKAGVTDLCCHGDRVYSCGRDGQYREFDIHGNQLELLHSNRVCKGFDWLARMTFQQGELMVLGFHTNEFVVYSVPSQQRLLTVHCGGGHRGWDMWLPRERATERASATFAYIKTREVVLSSMEIRETGTLLKSGLHGRDIMAVKHLWTENTELGMCHLCASCSEDTQVNLLQIVDSGDVNGAYQVLPLFPIAVHISSVRSLTTSHRPASSDVRSSLVFSGGGRSQMKCVKVTHKGLEGLKRDAKQEDNPIDCSSQDSSLMKNPNHDHCDKLSDNRGVQYEHLGGHMLHSKGKRKSWKFHDFDSDPETRFMDMSSLCVSEWTGKEELGALHLVFCACSDATVRIFCFDETTNQFHLVCHTTSLEHCMLKITHLTLLSRLIVMATGTDGCITLWDISDAVYSFLRYLNPDLGLDQAGKLSVPMHVDYKQFEFKEDEYFTLSDLEKVLDEDIDNIDMHLETNNEALMNVSDDSEDRDCTKQSVREEVQTTCSDPVDSEPVVPPVGQWKSQSLQLPQLTVAVHQSGINAMDWVRTEDGHILIVTGGDDNALCVNKLLISPANEKPGLSLVGSLSESSAHGAQIAGARFLGPSHVVTASIDQRLNIWHLDWQEDQLSQEGCRFVHVSDVANLEVWKSRSMWFVAVCGMGMELLTLTERSLQANNEPHQGAS